MRDFTFDLTSMEITDGATIAAAEATAKAVEGEVDGADTADTADTDTL